MRHRKAGLKLNRTASHRKAMFRNMVTSLFKHERIRTTDAKAKELRRWADHLVTLAKRGDLHARRQALSIVREKEVVHKLFAEAAEKFGASAGGYTRVVKLGTRPGDAAPIALVELVLPEGKPKKKKSKKKSAKADTSAKAAAHKSKSSAADAAAPAEADAKSRKPEEAKAAAEQKGPETT
jgi:large subunit ribosomal protein L17